MLILVLNCGSSSIKFRVQDVPEAPGSSSPRGRALLSGKVGGIGGAATLDLSMQGGGPESSARSVKDHAEALAWLFQTFEGIRIGGNPVLSLVQAVGHRVVHGGARFADPVRITDDVEREIETLCDLAPLHNPLALKGIRGTRTHLGAGIPMVAVFDTAFHQTMPATARTYALPYEMAERHRVWRYGFHGIAHASLADEYARAAGVALADVRLITLQLGNGCSASAVLGGRSVETSMGFTPLEGLVMGTRSGDVDPSVLIYLAQQERVDPVRVEQWLNERSGLLGVSGRSNDMRELLRAEREERDGRAGAAIELFCHRIRKYVGAYLAVLGGADAVIFGGGIGEHAPEIRARVCAGMRWCGIELDGTRNARAVSLPPGRAERINADGRTPAVYVVATDEETWIARETVRCLTDAP